MKSQLVESITSTNLDFNTPGKVYTFLNPVSYLDALKHKELYQRFDGIFADSSILWQPSEFCTGKKGSDGVST